MLGWDLKALFSGRHSSGPPKICDNNSGSSNSNNSNNRSTPARGKTGQALHGVFTSALWAIARTPALVAAVERVETRFGEAPDLSDLLLQLGHPSNLSDDDAPRLRAAVEAADAFLKANDGGLSLYSRMEPMDVIRGIVGLCGDSDKVFEEAVETTYRCIFISFRSAALCVWFCTDRTLPSRGKLRPVWVLVGCVCVCRILRLSKYQLCKT